MSSAERFNRASLLGEARAEAALLKRELEVSEMMRANFRAAYEAKVEDFARETRRVGELHALLLRVRSAAELGEFYESSTACLDILTTLSEGWPEWLAR